LTARWKAGVDFLLTVIEHLFLSLTVEALQGKTCQDSLLSGGVGQSKPRFQGNGSSLVNIFLVSTKLDTFLLSESANCTMLRAVVFTEHRRVTDGQTDRQTDRITIGSTVLAMGALRQACCKKWNIVRI